MKYYVFTVSDLVCINTSENLVDALKKLIQDTNADENEISFEGVYETLDQAKRVMRDLYEQMFGN